MAENTSLAVQLAEKFNSIREEFQRVLAETCPIPVLVTDGNGNWIYANKPLQDMLGAALSDLIGDGWSKRVYNADAAKVTHSWSAMFEKQPAELKIKTTYTVFGGQHVTAYMQLTKMQTGTYIGFLMPVCENPVNCPVHGQILHHLDSGSLNIDELGSSHKN